MATAPMPSDTLQHLSTHTHTNTTTTHSRQKYTHTYSWRDIDTITYKVERIQSR